MKRIMIFGASGTVGAGVLLECLDHSDISEVICVLRRPTGRSHPKLREILHQDFSDFSSLAADFQNIDGCLWAVGVPQTGLTEQQYTKITYGYTVAAIQLLCKESPHCCFVFISGAGADETGTDRSMWARVKGEAEVAVLEAGFARSLIFRPGAIATKRGIKHNTPLYGLSAILAPLMRPFGFATSTLEIGRAFIASVLGQGISQRKEYRLDSAGINSLAKLAAEGRR